jgi:hypothetical protein
MLGDCRWADDSRPTSPARLSHVPAQLAQKYRAVGSQLLLRASGIAILPTKFYYLFLPNVTKKWSNALSGCANHRMLKNAPGRKRSLDRASAAWCGYGSSASACRLPPPTTAE